MSAKKAENVRVPTKFMGVYQLESTQKRFDGKPDLCFYITYKSPNGKKVWEKIGWRSEKMTASMASDIRADRMQQLRLGEAAVPIQQRRKESGMTFGEAWAIFDEKWLPNLKGADNERMLYTRYLEPVLKNRPLKEITSLEMEGIKTSLLAKGLAAASVRLIIGNVRRVYNKLTEWDLYSGPKPMDKVKMPKVDNARDRFLTADEAQTLLGAVKKRSQLWHDISLTSLHTGMRLSEVLGLRPQDVNLKSRLIHPDGKTGKRSIPMNDTLFETLDRVVAERKDSPLLFPGQKGTQLGSDSATSSFARAVADAKLNPPNVDRRHKVVFHTLRHTYCSWLAMEGVPLYVIGEMVGHSSTEMTKRYSHLCPDKKSQTVNVIQGIFAKGKAEETEKLSLKAIASARA
ncbi:site-specific integrase [Desulfovibrio desulfuricans]|uniref:tyrosine-type recombinase/integrase n=1 Tax=Desulfovibrio desulfuricans TaxID=876 RepID=UPI0003B70439|nr:site-specific integrase [Desulfovibrio desulfuricans]